MTEKPATERRVYVLPSELLERLRAYQAEQGITSEVEAARRLLDSALQMRDTAADILQKLKASYAEEKDLRILARDILTGHPLVSSVSFHDDYMEFSLKNGESGQIFRNGLLYARGSDGGDFHLFEPVRAPLKKPLARF